jgi:hypothetical protein
LPTLVLQNQSPFSKLFKKEPVYTLLRTFGCLCYPLLRPYATHKLQFRSKPCIFIGYGANQRGYRCLEPQSQKVYLSRNVVFDETNFPAKGHTLTSGSCTITTPLDTPIIFHPAQLSPSPTLDPYPSPTPPQPLLQPPIPDIPSSSPIVPSLHTSPPASPNLSSPLQPNPDPLPFTIPVPLFVPSNRRITRSLIGSSKPHSFLGFTSFLTTKHPLFTYTSILLPPEPSTYRQAASKPEWVSAMTTEFQVLLSNNTWSLCPHPLHHNVVRNKWVFKIKQDPDGSIERYKARFVAKGFDQLCGVDYRDTFSPVIKPATIRLLLVLAVNFNWTLKQLDESNAFLHGLLNEEVCMEQPQEFVDPAFPHHVCKLDKALYGLKQAPRAWFTRLSQTLLEIGFLGLKWIFLYLYIILRVLMFSS